MGRYNFAALRHRSLALQKFDSRRIDQTPAWFSALTTVPVSQILVRQQPIPHPISITRTRTLLSPKDSPNNASKDASKYSSEDPSKDSSENSAKSSSISPADELSQDPPKPKPRTEQHTFIATHGRPRRTKKKSRGKAKLFKPVTIHYEEDKIRTQFFSDHPWELARPRVVLEQTGDDAADNGHDWSEGVVQAGKALSGESCIQRTLWLLQNAPDITWDAAYTIARKEFYSARLKEDIERRIAPEEATHYGVSFGPTIFEKSMRYEDAAFEEWRSWANREQEVRLQARAGAAAPPTRTGAEPEDGRNEGRARDIRGVRGSTDDFKDDYDTTGGEFEGFIDDVDAITNGDQRPEA